jgi:beta-fructofuranosidase
MKTVSDGTRRYILGWLSTRSREHDAGHRQWGGDLVVHELVRRNDGSLGVAPVDAVVGRFASVSATGSSRFGDWITDGDGWRFSGDGLGFLSLGQMTDACLIDVTLDVSTHAEELAVVLRADPGLEHGYYLRLEPRTGRIVFDRRPHHIFTPFDADADRLYVEAPDHEIERPLPATDGQVHVRVIVDGSAIMAYVNDVALSTRGYDLVAGEWGIVAANGESRVTAASCGRLRGS